MSTFTAQVGASARDAQQAAVGNSAVITDVSLQTAGRAYWGIAWTNVTIGQGNFIASAIIETYGFTKYPSMATTIYAEAANNAAAYAATSNNLSNRTRTSASVAHTTTYTADGWQSTPDVRTLVQEVVNRAGWASGNALSTIWLNTTTGTGATAQAYDGNTTQAAKITIVYYAGQGAVATGLAITATLGTATRSGTYTASLTGLAITATLGTVTATPGAVTESATGLAIVATLGTPTVTATNEATVTGLAAALTLGDVLAQTTFPQTIDTTGLALGLTSGTLTAMPGPVTRTTTGLALTLTLSHARAIRRPITTRNAAWTAHKVTRRYDARTTTTRWSTEHADTRWTPRKAER